MYYYKRKAMFIETTKEYQKADYLTVIKSEKIDVSKYNSRDNLIYSSDYEHIVSCLNGFKEFRHTPFESVIINGFEYCKIALAIAADVIKSDSVYMFYQFENVLVMTNENGTMYLAGRKHS
jgi:hypothetical protein